MIPVSDQKAEICIEKSGFIQSDAFFKMLDLHNIKLQKQDEQAIRTYFEKNGGYLKYKEVL